MGTIADKLTYLNDTKTAIKTAISNRGVAVADTDTFRSYAEKIGSIGETVDKTRFGASIDTWIGDVDENGVLQKTTWSGALNFAGVEAIDANELEGVFYGRSGITSVDLSSLQSVSNSGLQYTFYECRGITSVDLSSLQSVSIYGLNHAFDGCTGIISVDLSSLQSVGNSGLQYTFRNCTKLAKMSFPSLTIVPSNGFGTSATNGAFAGCSALTEIHFRADMQSTVEAMSGYSSKWGATNATIYFDL